MKILYAIQGTGNGHLSRAMDIIPILKKWGEVDILVSGIQADLELPFTVKYKLKGLSFIFGKKGGIALLDTYRKSNLKRFYKEIKSLPVADYDFVINDFEPVSAWACKMINKPCIGLSHQIAVMDKKSPKPKKKDPLGKAILHNYVPLTEAYGFHFKAYGKNIFTPVIRSQIRNAIPQTLPHYTVYLPAWSDERIIKVLSALENIQWQVFSKHAKEYYSKGNIEISPVNNNAFVESFINCTGILCGAGFETPAEAMFLKKKLMVIPMSGQYEQQCNAAALQEMGIPVLKKLKLKHLQKIKAWTESATVLSVHYPDITASIINDIIELHTTRTHLLQAPLDKFLFSAKKLQQASLGKILKAAGR